MRPEDHTLVPRRTRRPGAQGAHAAVPAAGHSARSGRMLRRSSFAVAAALTTVALSTTAAVSFTGSDDAANSSTTAVEPAVQPAAVAITSAVVTDPDVRSASEKADAVLTDADYVTREGDLTVKDRKKLQAATKELRTMLDRARDAAVTATGLRQNTAASRSTERASLAERAADVSAAGSGTADGDARGTAADATDPTNLAVAAAGVTPLGGQQAESLPILDTPLADAVVSTAAAKESEQAEKSADAEDAKATAESAAAAAPSADRIEKVTTSLQRLITKTDGDAVVSVKPGPTPEEIAAAKKAAEERREARAERKAERKAEVAREKAAARAKEMAKAAKSYGNGQIPSSVLCGLSFASGEQLRCDAAVALEDLNRAFRGTFGRNLDLTDGYRSYGEQVAVAASRGALAAVPGTSNHGLGQAVDLSGGIESFGSAEHAWMVANAGKYGWKHPGWAQAGGSKPEAWHWEYGTKY
ncbi:M15 family metallopeptidase [Promicromonospora sp. MEB111]|uniref:M15 family metallopeptidase n=1 Tax=Promicromonospora sp. MEB111 TaxID=3040301 RepID=UPI00254FE83E|nr:M15 family metallopeptidase [Promicromonospora sp. MEB111]